MDARAIGAGSLADAGLRRLASETDGPRPAGIEKGNIVSVAGEGQAAAADDSRQLRPTRP